MKPEREWPAIIGSLQSDIAANDEEAIGRAAIQYFDLEDTPAVRSALAAYLLPLMATARGGESAIACRLRNICRQRDPSSYVHRKVMALLCGSRKMRLAKATAAEPALLEIGAIDIEFAVDPATEIDWQEVAMELTRRGRFRLSAILDRYERGLALLDRDRKFLRRKKAEVRWAALAVREIRRTPFPRGGTAEPLLGDAHEPTRNVGSYLPCGCFEKYLKNLCPESRFQHAYK
ncbi:MAG TPA: hypothetical protein VM120_05350 [Bryobacteraceae bacterium]|nr:hypothetical protein [Bryobacteraceae bacterium]